MTLLARSGCYLTHDSGFYNRLLGEVERRNRLGPAPRLLPALEVWARVLSTPEPGLAILSAGKRDLSYDIDLPNRSGTPARLDSRRRSAAGASTA